MKKLSLCCVFVFVLSSFLLGITPALAQPSTERLGEILYNSSSLSFSGSQSCSSCHLPSVGFADPDNAANPVNSPVSASSTTPLGSIDVFMIFGGRNAPTAAYAAYSPVMFYDKIAKLVVGGVFWDGRATGWTLGDPLAEQALGPFLNPVEMQMPSKTVVVNESGVCSDLDLKSALEAIPGCTNVCGAAIDSIYNCIGLAIAAYEASNGSDTTVVNPVNKFSSDFDAGTLTINQQTGMSLFIDPLKGNCAACHLTDADPTAIDSTNTARALFTDFTYDNLGIPINPNIAAIAGPQPIDYGLGARVSELVALANDGLKAGKKEMPDGLNGSVLVIKGEAGKFKVSSLRNVGITPPYGHNGYFPTLESIVQFYNSRDVFACSVIGGTPATPSDLAAGDIPGFVTGFCWPAPEVALNVNAAELGNLGLSNAEVIAIADFMRGLTDH